MSFLDPFFQDIGNLFMESVKIAFIALILLIVGIVLLLGKIVLPKPWGFVVGMVFIGVAVYLIWQLM